MKQIRGFRLLFGAILAFLHSGSSFQLLKASSPSSQRAMNTLFAITASSSSAGVNGAAAVMVAKESSSSSSKSLDDNGSIAPARTISTFVSPMYQVYIEDTDAYAVKYNSNYIRSYDRALHSVFYSNEQLPRTNGSNEEEPTETTTTTKKSILEYDDWSIVQVDKQRFKSSPKLGGTFSVHGTLVEQKVDTDDDDDSMLEERWDLQLQETEQPDSIVYNTARVTLARPGKNKNGTTTPLSASRRRRRGSSSSKPLLYENYYQRARRDNFRLFRDEFDTHSTDFLPIRNALNLFERARTNVLGGPENLRKLQEVDRLLFVVTKIDDCCVFPVVLDDDGDDYNNNTVLSHADLYGQEVQVWSDFKIKRKGMAMDVYQTLILPASTTSSLAATNSKQPEPTVLAQAIVSLMTLNADTFKPSSDLPEWLRTRLEPGTEM